MSEMLIQLLTDPENQPHQFVGDADGLRKLLDAAERRVEREGTDWSKLYHELLYAVAKKHPGETRHQTALRYIQQAERGSDQCDAKSAARKDDNEAA